MASEPTKNSDENFLPLTEHDERIVRDTVVRTLRLHEVDLLIAWTQEIQHHRGLSAKEQRMLNLLLAQHCALYADCLQQTLVNNRKEYRERKELNDAGGSADRLADSDGSTDTQGNAGIGGEGP